MPPTTDYHQSALCQLRHKHTGHIFPVKAGCPGSYDSQTSEVIQVFDMPPVKQRGRRIRDLPQQLRIVRIRRSKKPEASLIISFYGFPYPVFLSCEQDLLQCFLL